MAHKKIPGLTKRGELWHINKKVNGRRIYESTGTSDLAEAERFLVHKLEGIRQASVYGVRPKRIFREAALKYVRENGQKATLATDICTIKQLDSFIGQLPLETIHRGSLQPFIDARKKDGVKARTINHGLQVVRRILNLASGEWIDEHGLTWLVTAPKIKLIPETDKRKPYPLSWDEQEHLFNKLPTHLKQMALFAVNTGCRDAEICSLKWEWEVSTPEGSVFIIPGEKVKNREERLVVLNKIARSVIEEARRQHGEYVFTYQGKPIARILNSGWKKARLQADLPKIRVHDLKHTFGRRLRAAGVSFEDRQDLLGHRSGRITTHYSTAELTNLLSAVNKACERNGGGRTTLLRS
jgi:integrase